MAKPAGISRHEANTIILPEGMTLSQAQTALALREREDEKEVTRQAVFEGWHPRDIVVATNRAMAETFGWVDARPNPSFFGTVPPKSMRIEYAPGKRAEFIYGTMGLSALSGEANLSGEGLAVSTRQKHASAVDALFERIERQLAEHSIYKGQAITDDFEFLARLPTSPEDCIFDDAVQAAVEANLWVPIRQWERVRELGMSPKRGVLLAGPYGTGKTLLALATARVAVDSGWTFVYVRPENTPKFSEIIEQSLRYAPVVVFLEDVDILEQGEGGLDISLLRNTLDGVTTKGAALMCVVSTNRLAEVHPALVRPGRFDAVIHLALPGPKARAEMLRKYVRNPHGEVNYALAARQCASPDGEGYSGAVLREVAERATLYALARNGGAVTTQDLVNSAKALQEQVALTKREFAPKVQTIDALFAGAVRQVGRDEGWGNGDE